MADSLETYRTVTPYLVVADADAELKFLVAAFGATERYCGRNEQGAVMHAEIHIGDSLVMVGQAGEQLKTKPASLYLWVPNVDEVYEKALAAGAASESAPEDKPYGHRNAGVVDSCGITWWIGAPVKSPKA
jgi:PhnB protein